MIMARHTTPLVPSGNTWKRMPIVTSAALIVPMAISMRGRRPKRSTRTKLTNTLRRFHTPIMRTLRRRAREPNLVGSRREG
jgi:hypothetical protein